MVHCFSLPLYCNCSSWHYHGLIFQRNDTNSFFKTRVWFLLTCDVMYNVIDPRVLNALKKEKIDKRHVSFKRVSLNVIKYDYNEALLTNSGRRQTRTTNGLRGIRTTIIFKLKVHLGIKTAFFCKKFETRKTVFLPFISIANTGEHNRCRAFDCSWDSNQTVCVSKVFIGVASTLMNLTLCKDLKVLRLTLPL